jgi:hypothetical protein
MRLFYSLKYASWGGLNDKPTAVEDLFCGETMDWIGDEQLTDEVSSVHRQCGPCGTSRSESEVIIKRRKASEEHDINGNAKTPHINGI